MYILIIVIFIIFFKIFL